MKGAIRLSAWLAVSAIIVGACSSDEDGTAIPTESPSPDSTAAASPAHSPERSTPLVPPPSPKPELTRETAAAALAAPARQFVSAWRKNSDNQLQPASRIPGNPGEAVAAAAAKLLAEHEPLEHEEWVGREDPLFWMDRVEELAEGSYFESIPEDHPLKEVRLAEQGVHIVLDAFNAIGVPGVPQVFYSGSKTVGEDIEPGTYVSREAEDCFWERLNSAGETIDNNFVSAAPRVEVTIRSTDFAFNSEGCSAWVEAG